MLLVSSGSCLYPIRWSQMLSWEWRCSWSSADRRYSNYIWVINNLIAYWSAPYIRELHKPATGKEICSYNARQGASITHFLQPQQKYLDLLNWEQISCNPQAELKSIHVFYSFNLANLFSCYFFYFSTVTFFPVTFFPTSPLLLSFMLLFFLLLFFLLLFFRYFFSCYFLSYNP